MRHTKLHSPTYIHIHEHTHKDNKRSLKSIVCVFRIPIFLLFGQTFLDMIIIGVFGCDNGIYEENKKDIFYLTKKPKSIHRFL